MTGETRLTLVGNLVADPELRWSPTGDAVVSLRVASTPRVFNRETREYDDGAPLFLTCSAWRALAEHCAESLHKGDRVTVTGTLSQRSYDDREGVRRTVYEVRAEDVSASLAFATAVLTRTGTGRRVASVPERPAEVAS